MLTADLFGLEELYFLEPSYDRLIDDRYSDQLVSLEAQEGRVLVDEEERPLGMAVRTDRWYAISLTHRQPNEGIIALLDDLDLKLYQTRREDYLGAVREYYSVILAHTEPPAMEDFSSTRMAQVKDLVQKSFKVGKKHTVLDVGCGSGLGSAAVHALGMKALAYDMDRSLLSLGLNAGRLFFHETMQLDASRASQYLEPVQYGMVLMAGKIGEYNSFLWRGIIQETLALSRETLITVETKEEAEMVKSWCKPGRKVELFENERDPFYDRWVVIARS